MSYDEGKKVELQGQERLGRLLADMSNRLKEVKGELNPAADDWPLEHGQVGVIFVPQNPPTTACILEHPETGHWMLQYPCDGIFIYDLTTDQPTF
ncbi:MAG TPA: hypothetical protein VGD58_20995 [Herpetosiphonaceae bacterium]